MLKINNIIQRKYSVWIIFATIYIIYLISGFGVTTSNDSVTNIDQIAAMDILSRSSHFSFHLFGAAFYYIFSVLLGFEPITSVEVMLSTFSITGTICLYFIAKKYLQNDQIAIIASLIYAFTSGVFRFSIQAEYLVMVPSFALISLALFAYNRFLYSGFVFAIGILTSPFVLLFAPMFMLFLDVKRVFSKGNFIFALGFMAMYLMVSFFTFQETITGNWSYKVVLEYYSEALLKLNYLRIGSIWVYGYLRSFNILLVFFIIGLVSTWHYDRRVFWIAICIVLVHLPVAVPEARYGGYQLTAYPVFAMITAIALFRITEQKSWLVVTGLSLFLILNFYIVLSERIFNRRLRDTYTMLQNDLSIPDGTVVLTYQASKPIQTVYAPRVKAVNFNTDYLEKLAANLPGYLKTDLKTIVSSGTPVYLLESGMSMPDDNIKTLFSGFVKGQGAKIKGFGREKLISCCVDVEFVKLPSYPIDVYRVIKKK